jgi:hypothetical protein
MFRILLECTGVPKDEGPQAAADITKEFAEHRPWHRNVRCTWDGTKLTLSAENDFDPQGLALTDEFSDCIAAYTRGIDVATRLRVQSIHDV